MYLDDDRFFDDDLSALKSLAGHCARALASSSEGIAGGFIPDTEALGAALEEAKRLRTMHDELRSRAALLFPPDERPAEGCTLEELAEAVHERRRSVRARLGSAARILEGFLGIEAARQAYAEAIAALKSRASELLARVDAGDHSIAEIEKELRPFSLFMQAIGLEDTASDEAEDLYAELDGMLTPTAARGLATGRYLAGKPVHAAMPECAEAAAEPGPAAARREAPRPLPAADTSAPVIVRRRAGSASPGFGSDAGLPADPAHQQSAASPSPEPEAETPAPDASMPCNMEPEYPHARVIRPTAPRHEPPRQLSISQSDTWQTAWSDGGLGNTAFSDALNGMRLRPDREGSESSQKTSAPGGSGSVTAEICRSLPESAFSGPAESEHPASPAAAAAQRPEAPEEQAKPAAASAATASTGAYAAASAPAAESRSAAARPEPSLSHANTSTIARAGANFDTLGTLWADRLKKLQAVTEDNRSETSGVHLVQEGITRTFGSVRTISESSEAPAYTEAPDPWEGITPETCALHEEWYDKPDERFLRLTAPDLRRELENRKTDAGDPRRRWAVAFLLQHFGVLSVLQVRALAMLSGIAADMPARFTESVLSLLHEKGLISRCADDVYASTKSLKTILAKCRKPAGETPFPKMSGSGADTASIGSIRLRFEANAALLRLALGSRRWTGGLWKECAKPKHILWEKGRIRVFLPCMADDGVYASVFPNAESIISKPDELALLAPGSGPLPEVAAGVKCCVLSGEELFINRDGLVPASDEELAAYEREYAAQPAQDEYAPGDSDGGSSDGVEADAGAAFCAPDTEPEADGGTDASADSPAAEACAACGIPDAGTSGECTAGMQDGSEAAEPAAAPGNPQPSSASDGGTAGRRGAPAETPAAEGRVESASAPCEERSGDAAETAAPAPGIPPLPACPAFEEKEWPLECRLKDAMLQSQLKKTRGSRDNIEIFRILFLFGLLTSDQLVRLGRTRGFFKGVKNALLLRSIGSLATGGLLLKVRNALALPDIIRRIGIEDKTFFNVALKTMTSLPQPLTDKAAAEAIACADALIQCLDLWGAAAPSSTEVACRKLGTITVPVLFSGSSVECRIVPAWLAHEEGAALYPLPGRTAPGDFVPPACEAAYALCEGGRLFRYDEGVWTESVPPEPEKPEKTDGGPDDGSGGTDNEASAASDTVCEASGCAMAADSGSGGASAEPGAAVDQSSPEGQEAPAVQPVPAEAGALPLQDSPCGKEPSDVRPEPGLTGAAEDAGSLAPCNTENTAPLVSAAEESRDEPAEAHESPEGDGAVNGSRSNASPGSDAVDEASEEEQGAHAEPEGSASSTESPAPGTGMSSPAAAECAASPAAGAEACPTRTDEGPAYGISEGHPSGDGHGVPSDAPADALSGQDDGDSEPEMNEAKPSEPSAFRPVPAGGMTADPALPILPDRPEEQLPPASALVFNPDAMGMDRPLPSPEEYDLPRGAVPASVEAARLLAAGTAPGDDDLYALAVLSLKDKHPARVDCALPAGLADALLLMETLPGRADSYPRCSLLRAELEAATGRFCDTQARAGFRLAGLFYDGSEVSEACRLAAFMLALFRPAGAHDHRLISDASSLAGRYAEYFPHFPECREVFRLLSSGGSAEAGGFNEAVLTALEDRREVEKERAALRAAARALPAEPKIKSMLHGIPELIEANFGKSGMFGEFISALAAGSPDADTLAACIAETFLNDEGETDIFKLESHIDTEWSRATEGLTTHKLKITGNARRKLSALFRERIELAARFDRLSVKTDLRSVEMMRGIRLKLIDGIRRALNTLSDRRPEESPFRMVVQNALGLMLKTLTARRVFVPPFADLLRSGRFSVDGAGMPIIDPETRSIRFFEPWRRALEHIADTESTLSTAYAAAVDDESSRVYDDLQRRALIGWCLAAAPGDSDASDVETEQCEKLAESRTRSFREELVMACTRGAVTESAKDEMLRTVDAMHDRLLELHDFGQWRELLHALKRQADEMAEGIAASLRSRLQEKALDYGGTLPPLFGSIEEDIERGYYAVAEDRFNRLESGAEDYSTSGFSENDSLAEFLSEDVFDELYKICRAGGESFRKKGLSRLESAMPAHWTARQKDECRDFVKLWPGRAPNTGDTGRLCEYVRGIFEHLRLEVTQAAPSDRKCARGTFLFTLKIRGTAPHLEEYPHPFADFGTRLRRLNVAVMFGGREPRDIVEEMKNLNLADPTVLLLDHQFDRAARRQLSDECHKSAGLSPFLVIDRPLFLHLVPRAETERLPLLLRCALPFAAAIQPFNADHGATPDEMFCGRTDELRSVLDPAGACVVYGGRQLGKTALLQRAEKMFARSDPSRFALWVDIRACADEASAAAKIAAAARGRLEGFPSCSSFTELCAEFRRRLESGTLQGVLLLIDEADAFLGSIAGGGYGPLAPLVELRRQTGNDFKFVLAGLNNVCRAKNATADNGIFGQMGTPLCIRPLSPRDAFMLISRPLEYLGFRCGAESPLPTVLANTNYYPGIIQFFGRAIVESLRKDYGTNYSAKANPPFMLTDDLLGRIIASGDIRQSIREKFLLTLNIDREGERLYYLLPCCIALLCRLEPDADWKGFTVGEIRSTAADFDLSPITRRSDHELTVLLDEMEDMGILSSMNGRYRFLRSAFTDIIGPDVDSLFNSLANASAELALREGA